MIGRPPRTDFGRESRTCVEAVLPRESSVVGVRVGVAGYQQMQKIRFNTVWSTFSIHTANKIVSEGGVGHLRHGLRPSN